MITERTLRKWRKEALKGYQVDSSTVEGDNFIDGMQRYICELHERTLKLTQELLDQHLLRREK